MKMYIRQEEVAVAVVVVAVLPLLTDMLDKLFHTHTVYYIHCRLLSYRNQAGCSRSFQFLRRYMILCNTIDFVLPNKVRLCSNFRTVQTQMCYRKDCKH